MKKAINICILILTFVFTIQNIVSANTGLPKNSAIYKAAAVPSAIQASTQVNQTSSGFPNCIKNYAVSGENLFYLTLSALNDANYQIEEIQFKSGTIIFKAYSKEFIAIIARKDMKNSFIKFLPADNTYNFSQILLQRLFDYIDFNSNSSAQTII